MLPILLAIAPVPSATPALTPNGDWTVAYEESMCLASRRFGADGEVDLLLRPSPLGDNVEVTFVQHGSTDRRVVLEGKGALTVSPGGQSFEASYKAWRSPSQKGRVIILHSEKPVLDALSDDSVLTLQAPKERQVAVSMRQLAKLKPVIEDCKRKVIQHWGIDLAVYARIARPAEPAEDAARWVVYQDYPLDALRKGQSGVVTLLWSIDEAGKVSECKVVASSGVPTLDRAGCSAIERRARYRPALDKDGRPILSHGMRRIMWLVAN